MQLNQIDISKLSKNDLYKLNEKVVDAIKDKTKIEGIMAKQRFNVGDKVIVSDPKDRRVRGKKFIITKKNPSKARVLELKPNGEETMISWSVPYSMLKPVPEKELSKV